MRATLDGGDGCRGGVLDVDERSDARTPAHDGELALEPFKGTRPDLASWSLLPHDPRPWHGVSAPCP